MPCLFNPDMHHTCLCIMPSLCLCVYHVVCFFPVLLLSSSNVAIVRIHSSTLGSSLWLHLLRGLVLLPCGISGKMTIPSKSLLSLLARCSLFCYAYATMPTTCYIMPPMLPCQASNHPFLANCCLAMLPLCSAPLINVAGCRCSCRLFHVGTWISWDITISLI